MLTWLRRQPPKVKAFLAVITGMAALVLLWAVVHDHDNIFIAAEAVHSIGIAVLIYKLMKEKTCAGKFNFPLFFSHAGRRKITSLLMLFLGYANFNRLIKNLIFFFKKKKIVGSWVN